jgi:hypothetical protein
VDSIQRKESLQELRRKGGKVMCEFCDKQYDNKPLAYSHNGDMEIENGRIVVGDFGATIADAEINYCPMCGRKLTEEK